VWEVGGEQLKASAMNGVEHFAFNCSLPIAHFSVIILSLSRASHSFKEMQ
jgi:hypothetical protein